ncbi:MAG TPA: methyltransferase domain-containing protein [Vicinamibacterales bacterium]|nr:methyltransferase domain-containing protein [Vicinamibacterales bacterium]
MKSSALLFVTLFVLPGASAQRSGSTIRTERIFEAIGVREGITVCEIGAGDGELTIAAARRVGPTGRVYTSELGDERVKTLQQNVARSGVVQITVVAGDPVRTNFPDGACDALFMRNVYHHFADPASMDASIAAAVKAGGKVAIVDFTPPNTEASTAADRSRDGMHGVSQESVTRELKEAGFLPETSEAGGQRWFMVVVSKPGEGESGTPQRFRRRQARGMSSRSGAGD